MTEGGAEVVRLHQLEEDQLKDYRRRTRLYCMNGGHHLQILPDGRVQGQRDEEDVHTVLKIKAVDRGVVVIQGTETGKYLAMNDEGCLYSSVSIHPGGHLPQSLMNPTSWKNWRRISTTHTWLRSIRTGAGI
ncbi:putative fibroblast growth factor 1 isoform X2 [Cynoglossus semilaevis]|uniref:putative fibroblast growth factor 1 isoform X2 n=1 Tax=Cynoglossus semilaevis TaxID=244447 RepID=UPI000D627EAE|nr:putative fibroblast growth factor 1 isoform X2 [Cynoglossus semilaevis]